MARSVETPAHGPRPSSPGDRIAKLLARAGVASRREIERMIAEGRVARNGVAIDTPATVLASLDGVTVDGQPVAAPEPARLFLYHKPAGLLVTERDPGGRPTIYDRLPGDLPRVVPVGRLDLNTEGLLLLTTDGGLKRQLELPATGVERTYRARCYGPVTQVQLEALIEGVEIEGVRYGAIDANLERRTGANVWIELTLAEGKNREVRRVLEHLGLRVGRLIRTRYGPFVLADLPPGAVGEVRAHDIESFRANPIRADLPQPRRRDAGHDPEVRRARPVAVGAERAVAPRRVASHIRPGEGRAPATVLPSGRVRRGGPPRWNAPERDPGLRRGGDNAGGPQRPYHVGTRDDAPGAPASARGDRVHRNDPHPGEGRGPATVPSTGRAPRATPSRSNASSPGPGLRRGGKEQPLPARSTDATHQRSGNAPALTPAVTKPQRKTGWAKPKPKSGPARPRKPRA